MLQGDRPTAAGLLSRTIDWGRTVGDANHAIWAAWAALWLGDHRGFGDLLRHAVDLARRHGELGALVEALGMQSVQLALLAQRYDDSTIAADEAVQMALELGAESLTLLPGSAQAIVAAVRGDRAAARRVGERVARSHHDGGHPFRASPARFALALVDLSAGAWAAALDQLLQIADPNDPALAIAAPEIVEAAVRAGQPKRAAPAFALLEQRVELVEDRSLQSRLASCRALLDPASADEHFQAAAAHIASARPFDRPRVELLHGEHLRRSGRRREAREHLRAAVDGFDAIGAVPWSDRARRELVATGEASRRRSPDTATQLTPQELQIARLVGSGLTNKEVAAQLYLSPRTIDAHLRGVFAKLGITSRRELRALDAGLGGQ